MLLVFASEVTVGPECGWTHSNILSQIRGSPNLEGQVPIFISLRNRELGFLFIASYDQQGYGGGIPTASTSSEKYT
jgi:hypothetical protein